MKSNAPHFQETDSVSGLYKSSLFKNLFKDRKVLLESYPATKKGLAFPEPCLKFGSSSYTFKTTDICDKVSCKHDDREFRARYKKETGKFDISTKVNCCPGVYGLIKYEERGLAAGPAYVFGLDVLRGALAVNVKQNMHTGALKGSFLFNADDTLKGLKLAGDWKVSDIYNVAGTNPLSLYNVGFSYASPAGLSAVAFSGQKNLLTLNHSLQVDKKISAILETVVPVTTGKSAPSCAVGLGYQVDREHQLRVRINEKAQIQCSIKKDFSPNLSLLAAACVDLQGGAKSAMSALTRPGLGFKVVTKV